MSLGGDLLQAIIRANGYREHHDQILATLSDPDARANAIASALDVEAARPVKESKGANAPTPPDWRKTEDYMKTCAEFSKDMEVQALAVFAATAFSDDTWVKSLDLSPFFAELQDIEPAQPPSAGVEIVVYTAMKDGNRSIVTAVTEP